MLIHNPRKNKNNSRRAAVDQRGALRRWVRQAAAVATAAASAVAEKAEAERARSSAALALSEGLARGHRRRLEAGFVALREGMVASRMKVWWSSSVLVLASASSF